MVDTVTFNLKFYYQIKVYLDPVLATLLFLHNSKRKVTVDGGLWYTRTPVL